MNITTDIIIIGAGIIGTATAFELGKKRYKTINIDKLPAAGQGSTGSLVLGNESEKLLNLLSKVGVEFEVWDMDSGSHEDQNPGLAA